MRLRYCAVLLAIGLAPVAHAEITGRGTHLDGRIQSTMYTADNVFRVNAVIGRSSVVELEPGETVNQDNGLITMGDPAAWKTGANKAGNMIAIKPATADEPNTNLVVNTNRRTYVFELNLVPEIKNMTYLLRFTYPQPPKVGDTPFKGRELNQNPCSGVMNKQYVKWGDMALSPSEVWDNGTFTCFRFPTNAPRPALYEVLPDGTESLTNFHQVNDIVVVHSVAGEFRLRLNQLVLGVKTNVKSNGWYNYNGTTTGERRGVKK